MGDQYPTRRGFVAAGGAALAGALVSTSSPGYDEKPDEKAAGGTKPLVLGLIQMRCDGKPADNLDHAVKLVKDASDKGAELVVLPELFATLYFCQDDREEAIEAAKKDLAVDIPGPTTKALAAAARSNRVVLVGGSVFESAGCGRYYNTSVVFGPKGNQLGVYRKTHIPHDPGFWEKHYFSPGDTGITVFNTPVGKVAVQICYDQWFPEGARLAALRGAEVLVYPTAIGDVDLIKGATEGNWQQMWTAAQVGHAACNNIFIAAVNRVGREGKSTFWGGSFVADPMGRILKQAGVAEEVVVVRCDRTLIEEVQRGWRFFRERRPDQYSGLTNALE